MLIVHAFAKFGTSFFKMELSRTQNELEESAESSIRETKEKYAGMVSSLRTIAAAFSDFLLYMMSRFMSNYPFLKT